MLRSRGKERREVARVVLMFLRYAFAWAPCVRHLPLKAIAVG